MRYCRSGQPRLYTYGMLPNPHPEILLSFMEEIDYLLSTYCDDDANSQGLPFTSPITSCLFPPPIHCYIVTGPFNAAFPIHIWRGNGLRRAWGPGGARPSMETIRR